MNTFERLESEVRGYCRSFPAVFSSANTATYFDPDPSQGEFSFTGTGFNTLTWTPVPEPSSLAGLLLGLAVFRRRR